MSRRFAFAGIVGGTAGLAVFLAMVLSATQGDLLRWQRLGDFYDVQAHSFLDGDLAVDGERLGIEAFFNDGRAYLYQGPVPALMRLPVVAVAGDRLDARLSAASMLMAVVIATIASVRLHWRVRSHVRGDAAVSVVEASAVGLFAFGVGGSLLLFQGSRVWVYHEAILWGVAFTTLAIDQLLAFSGHHRRRSLVLASFFATLALSSRASIGIGPLVGLGLSAGVASWRWIRRRETDWRPPVAAAAAAVVPLAAYSAVNFAKFESLFSIPFWDQRFSQVDDLRQEFLRETGGSFFSLGFIPTTLLRYLLPTGFHLMRRFPFVDLADPPSSRVSMGVTFDVIDRVAGVPVAQPFYFVVALAGLVMILRRRDLEMFRIPVIAAAASAATIFPFGYIAYRYLGDVVPFLILSGAVGLQVLLARQDERDVAVARRTSRRVGITGLALLGALALTSTWLNGAAALQYQRIWSVEADPALVAGYLAAQLSIDEALGVGEPPVEQVVATLPDGVGRAGARVVLGNCDGLYISDGEGPNSVDRSPWNPVERSRDNGHLRLRVTLPDAPPRTRLPLVEAGDDAFTILYVDPEHIRIDHASNDVSRDGLLLRHGRGDVVLIELQADDLVQHVAIRADDVVALDNYYFEREALEVTWPGEYDELKTSTPVCDRLVSSRR